MERHPARARAAERDGPAGGAGLCGAVSGPAGACRLVAGAGQHRRQAPGAGWTACLHRGFVQTRRPCPAGLPAAAASACCSPSPTHGPLVGRGRPALRGLACCVPRLAGSAAVARCVRSLLSSHAAAWCCHGCRRRQPGQHVAVHDVGRCALVRPADPAAPAWPAQPATEPRPRPPPMELPTHSVCPPTSPAGGHNQSDFFTQPGPRRLLKGYIAALLGRTNAWTGRRYGDDPCILGCAAAQGRAWLLPADNGV